ncbi:MAG TPA: type IV pilus biogenesis/stability protein PilW [Gammaproteobacteria bacterium]|nr:type IV pilus biogenesis/stability protein PilW [Gammaproteobacteria bacterium]
MTIARAWIILPLAVLLAACVTEGPVAPDEEALRNAANINVRLGVAYLQQGKLDLAKEKLEKAVEQDPKLPAAHTAVALLYERLGEMDKAKDHYRRALRLAPNDPAVRNNYGTFLCRRNELREAVEQFVAAARNPLYPTPAAAWTNAGVCARRIPDLEAAERYLREALAIDPEFPDALAQMADLTFERGDMLKTRGFLQRFLAQGKPTPAMLWLAVRTERALGDEAAARRYAERLRTEFPDADETRALKEGGR